MAMRLRRVGGFWVALCAATTEACEGDVYLDDAQDHAIRQKIEADWNSEGCGPADVDRLRTEAKMLLGKPCPKCGRFRVRGAPVLSDFCSCLPPDETCVTYEEFQEDCVRRLRRIVDMLRIREWVVC